MRYTPHKMLLSAIGMVSLLAACGGGGGGSGASATPSTPTTTATYLFFQGSLAAVDAANPASPIYVEPVGTNITQLAPFDFGRYDAATHRIDDIHFRSLVYGRGANLWKVSTLKGGATPTAVRLSNEAGLGSVGVCASFFAADYADHNNSRYAYETPGPDNNCSTTADNAWKLVKIGMTAADAPTVNGNIASPLTVIRNHATGAISGWLRLVGTNLTRYDADFGYPTVVVGGVSTANVLATATDGRVFLKLDNALKLYDPASYPTPGTGLSAALHTFTGAYYGGISDGAMLYFEDGQRAIFRVPLDGSTTAGGAFVSEGATATIDQLNVSNGRLVYAATDGGIVTLKAIPKTGGPALPIKVGAATQTISVIATVGSRVYYNVATGGAFPSVAGTVQDDGTGLQEHLSAFWSGRLRANSAVIGSDAPAAQMALFETATKNLKIYNAVDHSLSANVGAAPADINELFIGAYGNNGDVLAFGFDSASKTDIFYLNTASANSLARVTTTGTVNENVVGGCSMHRGSGVDAIWLLFALSVGWLVRRRRN